MLINVNRLIEGLDLINSVVKCTTCISEVE